MHRVVFSNKLQDLEVIDLTIEKKKQRANIYGRFKVVQYLINDNEENESHILVS